MSLKYEPASKPIYVKKLFSNCLIEPMCFVAPSRNHSCVQGYLAHQKIPTPLGPSRNLGIGLR